ncbi:MAG: ABC transporter ATP-binding protein [Gemmatimonadetes bacterium]|nr:ABC transporter ATP-binding protein [Gemmatimonadota bacterium]
MSDVVLRIHELSRHYVEGDRRHVVLDRTSAEIRRGEFVVLLGPSGSGKSTLLNLVSGIDRPDGGWVEIAGVRLTELDERERTLFRRNHIGFVFQFFNLLPTLTVEENLLLPLELKGRLDADAHERARALLETVGLGDRGGSFPDRLSGGEQQRVALARALVHDPELILADEPTGNLDPATGGRVLDLFDTLVRDAGRTLLAVTHSRELAAHADRVLRIEDGRLVEVAMEPVA